MRSFRRSLTALGVAAMLPTLVFAAVAIFYFLRAEGRRVEMQTLGRSQIVMSLTDAQLRGDLAALNILASSVYFESQNWGEFYPRLARVRSNNPHWATILIFDVENSTQILDLRHALTAPKQRPLPGGGSLDEIRQAGGPVIGNITRSEDTLVYIYVPVIREQVVRYVIVGALRPQVFQDILTSQMPRDAIAAVVDRTGSFVARNIHFAERVGTPATQYVRAAIAKGPQGLYRGRTYEGLENYTAYYTSAFSGWSAHVAVPSSLIDTPTTWSFVVAGLAALGSVALGILLTVLVLRDMAERRQADEALRLSQRMEAIGQLTGGIAHDFNNLLTAILGNLDMVRRRLDGDERLQRLADNALEGARRGAKLASRLLAFSRTQRMTIGPVDLEKLLGSMKSLLQQSVGPTTIVDVDIEPAARLVMSDANQLELALLNLAVNARDAMPHGGSVSISARVVADPQVSRGTTRTVVDLAVADVGSGMTEEVRARAIEPFFTTKPVGQGTGLGLSQVYGVVRESGGSMYIESETGRGTTVHLLLRRAEETAREGPVRDEEQATSEPPPVRRERDICVLVVDDDRLVRRFVVDSLRDIGYRTLEADGGGTALAMLDTATIDVLVVDFAMPGMNGAEVARAVKDRQPHAATLLISGYADSAAIDAAVQGARLLRKPFNAEELAAAIAELLPR